MFSMCKYCGDSNCWGHTNDEKSASEDTASKYYAKIESQQITIKALQNNCDLANKTVLELQAELERLITARHSDNECRREELAAAKEEIKRLARECGEGVAYREDILKMLNDVREDRDRLRLEVERLTGIQQDHLSDMKRVQDAEREVERLKAQLASAEKWIDHGDGPELTAWKAMCEKLVNPRTRTTALIEYEDFKKDHL